MKETKFDGNYNIVWDILNVIACIAVVILHVNGGFFGFANSLWWKFSVIIDTIFYWAEAAVLNALIVLAVYGIDYFIINKQRKHRMAQIMRCAE